MQACMKPKVVLTYNKLKGGVDTVDKATGGYTCRRKTNRWTVAIFYNLLDICAHNAFFYSWQTTLNIFQMTEVANISSLVGYRRS